MKETLMRMKKMVNMLRMEPSIDYDNEILCPGDPEKKIKLKRLKDGIPIEEELWRFIIENK